MSPSVAIVGATQPQTRCVPIKAMLATWRVPGWAESILLDPRTLSRGYFKAERVRELVDKHMVGDNLARELGMLLTIELWHRQVID